MNFPKLIAIIHAASACILPLKASESSPPSVVVAVPSALDERPRKQVKDEFLNFALKTATPGTTITLLDGGDGVAVISEFTIPHLPRDSASARIRKLRSEIAGAVAFFEESAGNSQPSATLNLPQIWEIASRSRPDVLLLVGSPIFRTPRGSDWDWVHPDGEHVGYWYPSDPSFFAPAGCPWRVSSQRDRLTGTRVHWLITGDRGPEGIYQDMTKRFLALYAALEGGQTVTWITDPRRVFKDLQRTDLSPLEYEYDASQTEVGMFPAAGGMIFLPAPPLDLTPEIPREVHTKPLDTFLVLDVTGSMDKIFGHVARMVSLMPHGKRYRWATFTDHNDPVPATVHEESENPGDIALALRAIELSGGTSPGEALEDALAAVASELRGRAGTGCEIIVFTDSPPYSPSDCPLAHDANAELIKLMKAGHRITLVRCEADMNLDWLPQGVVIKDLAEIDG